MGGLGFFLAIGLYLGLSVFIVRAISDTRVKTLAIVALVLLPMADAWWGRYVTLRELCKDAGLRVFKTASKQDGLMGAFLVRRAVRHERGEAGHYKVEYWIGERWLREYGIAFVEDRWPDKTYARLSLRDGKIIQESDVTPKTKYVLSDWQQVPTGFGTRYRSLERRIESRESGEVVARYRKYEFTGGWAERLLGGFSDSGPQSVWCPATVSSVDDILVSSAFK